MITTLQRDMLLMENQIPFFVLEWLFKDTVIQSSSGLLSVTLQDIALQFFQTAVSSLLTANPNPNAVSIRMTTRQSTKHLLHLIHTSCYLPHSYPKSERKGAAVLRSTAYFESPPSVTGLHTVGIKICRIEGRSIFDLKFSNGVLQIPPLRIHDWTDAVLRNLVAFEQCFHGCPQYVTSYVLLMDRLIYTTRDVELLEQRGVIENYTGSREDVTILFDSICKQIGLQEFMFLDLCTQLNRYCNRWWYRYKVALKREYFTSPWTFVMLNAAFLLLAMTLVQTVYVALSYQK